MQLASNLGGGRHLVTLRPVGPEPVVVDAFPVSSRRSVLPSTSCGAPALPPYWSAQSCGSLGPGKVQPRIIRCRLDIWLSILEADAGAEPRSVR